MGIIPKKYTARLNKKDKKKQLRSIRRAKRSYRNGKYIDRSKLKIYKSKKSSWVTKFERKYGKDIKTYKEINEALKSIYLSQDEFELFFQQIRKFLTVQEQVDLANSKVAQVQQIKKFTILKNEWTDTSGELTPTLKLKRNVIAETYNDEIESMYKED